jgi:hypothetical protein
MLISTADGTFEVAVGEERNVRDSKSKTGLLRGDG